MPLTLHVDGPRWRAHLDAVRDANPGLVPVLKGNGYGLGLPRLAAESARLGVDTVAVGMHHEVAPVAAATGGPFPGSVLVLTPWRPFETRAVLEPPLAPTVVHTVGRLEDLRALAATGARPRVVLERLTSMRRHGFSAVDLRQAAGLLDGVEVEGVAVHLPMVSTSSTSADRARRDPGGHLDEVDRALTDVVAAGLATGRATGRAPLRVFVSHLIGAELATLRRSWPDLELRPRVGTSLWLGDRGALRVGATVLDAHPVRRGDVYGYRGRHAPRAGTILVVSGGTAHGIGLEAPSGGASWWNRAARVAQGGLDAVGWVRSPFTVDGKARLFAEPPHMQASMLFLPEGAQVPEVGEEVPVRVRFTATGFDETVVADA